MYAFLGGHSISSRMLPKINRFYPAKRTESLNKTRARLVLPNQPRLCQRGKYLPVHEDMQ